MTHDLSRVTQWAKKQRLDSRARWVLFSCPVQSPAVAALVPAATVGWETLTGVSSKR